MRDLHRFQPFRQQGNLLRAAHIAGGDRFQFTQRIAFVQSLKIAAKPFAGNNAAVKRIVMRGITEQHRRHGGYPQAVRFNGGYGNAVADATVNHLRLNGDDIRLQRAVRIVEEHRLYIIILPHHLLLMTLDSGHAPHYYRHMLKFILS